VEGKLKVTGSVLLNLNATILNKLSYFYNAYLFACIITTCLTFIFPPISPAHQVTLAWDPNAESDLAGYITYWGTSRGNYPYLTDVGNNTSHTITGLEEDRVYYFAITAYDSEYNESDYSDELAYVVPSSDTEGSGGGYGGGGGGCFIATAAFGTPMAKHVKILSQFRDKILLPTQLGQAAIVSYYKHSPPLADYIASHNNLKRLVRWSLLPIIVLCWFALKLDLWATLSTFILLQCLIVSIPIAFRRRQKHRYHAE
jgi:hypothetical protein